MDQPHPVGTPIRARQQSSSFLTGPNLFNHSTIGKIIRFESDDYGFICLQCGSNYSESGQFLVHIETHFQIHEPDVVHHEEIIIPHEMNEAIESIETIESMESIEVIAEPSSFDADSVVLNSNQRSDPQPRQSDRTVFAEPVRKSSRQRVPSKKFASRGLYECLLCSYEFCGNTDLRRHKMRVHGHILSKIKIKDESCFCSLCGEEFGVKKFIAAEKHMKKHVDNGDF